MVFEHLPMCWGAREQNVDVADSKARIQAMAKHKNHPWYVQ